MKYFFTKNLRGVAALPSVMFVMMLILAIAIGIASVSFSESWTAVGSKRSTLALRYAEAGARDALQRIARNKNYSSAGYTINFVASGCTDNSGCARVSVSAATAPKVIIAEGDVNTFVRKVEVDVTFDASGNGEIIGANWQELTN